MASVIMQAVRDLGMPGEHMYGAEADLRDKARAWLLSRCHEPGSFLFFCQALDWDPGWIRERVRSGRYFPANGLYDMGEALVKQLNRLIEERGLSIAGVARDVGMHSQTLSGLLKGRRMRTRFVHRLAKYAGRIGEGAVEAN